jgi:hypothetical protein
LSAGRSGDDGLAHAFDDGDGGVVDAIGRGTSVTETDVSPFYFETRLDHRSLQMVVECWGLFEERWWRVVVMASLCLYSHLSG